MINRLILFRWCIPLPANHGWHIPFRQSALIKMPTGIQAEKHRHQFITMTHKAYVTRIDIGMYEMHAVHSFYRVKNRGEHHPCLFERERSSTIDVVFKRFAVKILHHIVECIVSLDILNDIYNPRRGCRNLGTIS